ncbi:vanin-like protein 1 [Planococcus citri]|uniref:vanin-like protein 1 n=1 Tax=Planococcus citri TaxID=170843 RepID=UPI0031F96E39
MTKSKKCIFSRRQLPWVLLYFILACLCSAAVYSFIPSSLQGEENTIAAEERGGKHGITTESENFIINVPSENSNESQYYLAAVIDYDVSRFLITPIAVKNNLKSIVDIIGECGRLMVDIVVFPEGGIFGFFPIGRIDALLASSYVPATNEFIVPCNEPNYRESLVYHLSCAAKENNIYVAVNLIEKARSWKSTAWDGLVLYNTAVVFDRNGMVIARYRKFNLYKEKYFNEITTTDEPEYVTFTTDFGVEFGIFTCFDLFFDEPALELVRKRNITHFIHLSQMLDRLPFLIASVVDFGWSYASDVVVLTSSIPSPGSNIHFGRRQGTRTYVRSFQTSNIIIAPVPKHLQQTIPQYPEEYRSLPKYNPVQKIKPSSFLKEHIQNKITSKRMIAGNENSSSFSYTSSTFQCNVKVSWKRLERFIPNYQFVAYSGLNNLSIASINNYNEMCGITLCSEISYSSCQLPPRFEDATGVILESVHISARSTVLDSIRIPSVIDADLMPFDVAKFYFDSRAEEYSGKMMNVVDMRLEHPTTNLLTFGVYKFVSKSQPMDKFNIFDDQFNADTT